MVAGHIVSSVRKQTDNKTGAGLENVKAHPSYTLPSVRLQLLWVPGLLSQHHQLGTKGLLASEDISDPNYKPSFVYMSLGMFLNRRLLDLSYMETMNTLMPRISIRFN